MMLARLTSLRNFLGDSETEASSPNGGCLVSPRRGSGLGCLGTLSVHLQRLSSSQGGLVSLVLLCTMSFVFHICRDLRISCYFCFLNTFVLGVTFHLHDPGKWLPVRLTFPVMDWSSHWPDQPDGHLVAPHSRLHGPKPTSRVLIQRKAGRNQFLSIGRFLCSLLHNALQSHSSTVGTSRGRRSDKPKIVAMSSFAFIHSGSLHFLCFDFACSTRCTRTTSTL